MSTKIAVGKQAEPLKVADPDRQLVAPEPKSFASASARHVPTFTRLLSDAMSIVGYELEHYARESAKPGRQLTESESRIVGGHIRSLVALAIEDRERNKRDPLDDLSDEELVALGKRAIKALREQPKENE